MRRANLAVFAGAGVGLALCDLMHVKAGVLVHRAGGPFGQAWWVAPMFGCAGLAITHGAHRFARLREGVRPPSDARVREGVRPLSVEAVPFVGEYASTALVSARHPRALAAALWATGLVRARGDLRFALLLAAAGPAVEVAVARTGAFAYARPEREVIPWLSGLYVHGAPLALATARAASAAG